MNRFVKGLISFVLTASLILPVTLSANNSITTPELKSITVTYNDEAIVFPDAKPFADEAGRIQVPIRFIGEALGLEVDYKTTGSKRVVEFTDGLNTAEFVVGSKIYSVNGQSKTMDTASVAIDGRTYTPARYVAESFGASVQWDQATKTVKITGSTTSLPPININQILSAHSVPSSIPYLYEVDTVLQQYKPLAVALMQNRAVHLVNAHAAKQNFKDIVSNYVTSNKQLSKITNPDLKYNQKPTSEDYGWSKADVEQFVTSLSEVNVQTPLTTNHFVLDNGQIVLSYRYTTAVNNVEIWLEVQFTFTAVGTERYVMVDILP